MEPIIADQLVLPVAPPEYFRFDDYYSGENEQVVQYLKGLIKAKPDCSHLCYLNGKAGTGKTHLLHAVAEHAESNDLPVIYLDLSALLPLSVECVAGLEQYKIVCLDNIHLVKTSLPWQKAVFDLINRVLEVGHYIVFSGIGLPKSLDIELKDLVSRLDWGVSFNLKPLTDEQLVEALMRKASAKGLKLSKDVAGFLIKHFRRDMSSLVVVLEQLDERSLKTQKNLTIPFVKAELNL
ncbi:DnaA regulatory inactivator Hda [Alteromonas sp. a30]|uniref:DnaA regulatory inactivator Hda n=1 Tax=Alteromonas sp. a30 TaxID=2730917 RepID=UPI002280CFAD|nr:DnaA regulatory inactivator Hda [Alteromonas sp. a30]MCY7294108.1 DnaA regulatory inactivator Hda [Alteromonas sp. a30]